MFLAEHMEYAHLVHPMLKSNQEIALRLPEATIRRCTPFLLSDPWTYS